ncbi:1, 4-beta cellobiohydrolase [Sphaerosporella brunnea]|uniref:Glucanase n=1 Tax=Sphaerosporella brunnea TaxID=1250544 RepID=A0A5J5F8Z9_9PEZI|nr:1, 4-beta cellobiohydrolase [Sphaerosporella brunnea]
MSPAPPFRPILKSEGTHLTPCVRAFAVTLLQPPPVAQLLRLTAIPTIPSLGVSSLPTAAMPTSLTRPSNPSTPEATSSTWRAQGASTFLWVSELDAIPGPKSYLDEAIKVQQKTHKKQIVPFMIDNLPGRDCKYRQFVDEIYATITTKPYNLLEYAAVVEPNSLSNSTTNTNVAKCATATPEYAHGIGYVIQKLGRMENVALYQDAAHSNWLGWPANPEPMAKLMKDVVAIANGNQTNPQNPAKIRGYSTNAQGLPVHFIIDQGRSGQQDIRASSSDWCNINHAGFGVRPTTNTGDCIIDALVWVKPGGQSDGTTNLTSPRFHENCVSADAFTPSPEAGSWNEGCVEMLVKAPLGPAWG